MGEGSLPLSDRVRLAHLVKSTSQHRVLIRLAKEHGWEHGAEIGVLRGKTLFAILDALPALRMVGVDQWKQLELRSDENAETYADFDMRSLMWAVTGKAAQYGDRCRILAGDSAEMAAHVANGALDFCFIDGDHTEAGIERDIIAWAPKVKASGMVLGHDCHWETVKRVINRRCPGWTAYGEAVWGVPQTAVAL